jgi:transposase InsO family protein
MGPHPYKASQPHQYWFIDGRMMDFAFDGVRWWSILILAGYSRTILAGALAPSEASWAPLMVLYTACARYGAPQTLISDSGGAYIAQEFEAVCTRLEIDHPTIVSTQGESYMNLMETHFNIQRRLYDYQFSLSQNPVELEQTHQAFIQTYHTTAHQGLLKDGFDPPIPSVVLHSYHFYVEQGLPKTQVWLWVYGEQLRAMLDNMVLAEYHCRYDWRDHKVSEVRDGVFYPTPFAAIQGVLIPLNEQEVIVVYRPKSRIRQTRLPVPAHQLWLFELVQPA